MNNPNICNIYIYKECERDRERKRDRQRQRKIDRWTDRKVS